MEFIQVFSLSIFLPWAIRNLDPISLIYLLILSILRKHIFTLLLISCLDALYFELGFQQSCQAVLQHGCPLHATEIRPPGSFCRYALTVLLWLWLPTPSHSTQVDIILTQSVSDTSCQAALLCGYPPPCAQALRPWVRNPSFADTFHTLVRLLDHTLGHNVSISFSYRHLIFCSPTPNGFRTKLFKKERKNKEGRWWKVESYYYCFW